MLRSSIWPEFVLILLFHPHMYQEGETLHHNLLKTTAATVTDSSGFITMPEGQALYRKPGCLVPMGFFFQKKIPSQLPSPSRPVHAVCLL